MNAAMLRWGPHARGTLVGKGASAGCWLDISSSSRRLSVMRDSWPKSVKLQDPGKASAAQIVRKMDRGLVVEGVDEVGLPRHVSQNKQPIGPSPNAGAPPRGSSRTGSGGASHKWHPPGWDSMGASRSTDPRQSRKKSLEAPRPMHEIWGMRIMGLLLLVVVVIHVGDLEMGPQGVRRRVPKKVYDYDQEPE
mmetsp:Transcript_25981/g.57337  ORF Transcript_25981/g.57337 Transcript_25981/m.57337 type:complete len:192 (-) Transcript_25981:80-655(-)